MFPIMINILFYQHLIHPMMKQFIYIAKYIVNLTDVYVVNISVYVI